MQLHSHPTSSFVPWRVIIPLILVFGFLGLTGYFHLLKPQAPASSLPSLSQMLNPGPSDVVPDQLTSYTSNGKMKIFIDPNGLFSFDYPATIPTLAPIWTDTASQFVVSYSSVGNKVQLEGPYPKSASLSFAAYSKNNTNQYINPPDPRNLKPGVETFSDSGTSTKLTNYTLNSQPAFLITNKDMSETSYHLAFKTKLGIYQLTFNLSPEDLYQLGLNFETIITSLKFYKPTSTTSLPVGWSWTPLSECNMTISTPFNSDWYGGLVHRNHELDLSMPQLTNYATVGVRCIPHTGTYTFDQLAQAFQKNPVIPPAKNAPTFLTYLGSTDITTLDKLYSVTKIQKWGQEVYHLMFSDPQDVSNPKFPTKDLYLVSKNNLYYLIGLVDYKKSPELTTLSNQIIDNLSFN